MLQNAKKPLFVNYQSAILEKSKINFIRNERKRIEDKCSTKTTSTTQQNMFDDVLCLKVYSESNIDQTKHPLEPSETPSTSQQRMVVPEDPIYF